MDTGREILVNFLEATFLTILTNVVQYIYKILIKFIK